jgi:hypothetical protein
MRKAGAEREGAACARGPAAEGGEMGRRDRKREGDARSMMMAWLICSGTTTLM